ncbi:MAG: Druantia anti-phage system protein DruA, partial [Comamonadaceae bacterium]
MCSHLAWFSPNGRPAISGAKVALRKLSRRGLLSLPLGKGRYTRTHRLQPSGQPLPPVLEVPKRVERVQGLYLHLISGSQDPLHGLWNDLIIQQHPCGDAPLVGAQLRYLIGSDHGWLGAIGFGPAAFALRARDQWIGWPTEARLSKLNHVVGLARLLIRQEVICANLGSLVLSRVLERLPSDWQARYGICPMLVETFVDRSRFTGRTFGAANWQRIGMSSGQGRLGALPPVKTLKDIWVFPLTSQARRHLQAQAVPVLTPQPVTQNLAQTDWCAHELDGLDLGDKRLDRRAQQILEARWQQPQA